MVYFTFLFVVIGLPLSETTMPEYLKNLGYKNHIVGKWHLGHYKSVYTPLSRGFDSHYGYWTGHQDYYDHTAVEWVQIAHERLVCIITISMIIVKYFSFPNKIECVGLRYETKLFRRLVCLWQVHNTTVDG